MRSFCFGSGVSWLASNHEEPSNVECSLVSLRTNVWYFLEHRESTGVLGIWFLFPVAGTSLSEIERRKMKGILCNNRWVRFVIFFFFPSCIFQPWSRLVFRKLIFPGPRRYRVIMEPRRPHCCRRMTQGWSRRTPLWTEPPEFRLPRDSETVISQAFQWHLALPTTSTSFNDTFVSRATRRLKVQCSQDKRAYILRDRMERELLPNQERNYFCKQRCLVRGGSASLELPGKRRSDS